jgi:hypothetical protein
MSELFLEIYKNSGLNRNVSTLVVEYLTDPPILPFLKELCKTTFSIESDVGTFIFNTKSYKYPHNLCIFNYKSCIRKMYGKWYIYVFN